MRFNLIRAAAFMAALVVTSTPLSAFEGRVVRPDGSPVVGAEVSVLGRSGVAITDGNGRFMWTPDPTPPFEVLVTLPGGRVLKPTLVPSLSSDGPLQILTGVEESITVTAGGAPGIAGSPASGTMLLPSREFSVRQPANLTQLLENVAGVSPVSEGQAAVPAIRGLARGRTLLLIDGARVASERRVGPSATTLDPAILESVEVSRGPATVAYGSDAFGGVILARTRGAVPGSGWGGRFLGDLGTGIPERRGAIELSHGFEKGGLLVGGHYREAEDYDSPDGPVFNSGFRDYGFRARGDRYGGKSLLTVAWQTDLGRDIERPRDNSSAVRFFYPTEDSHRATASLEATGVGGWSRLGANAFVGRYAVVTDQDRFAAAAASRNVERADVAANDFHVRGFGQRSMGKARLEVGVDVNGRFGLEAFDIGLFYRRDGSLERATNDVSVEDAHRTDVGVYVTVEAPLAKALFLSAGARADRVTTENQGGYFGDRATAHGDIAAFAALGAGPFGGVTLTAQVSRGFRDPVLSDRYFRGPTGRGFITGNPDLDPERSLQFDSAVRYSKARVRAAFHAYSYSIDDLIERYQTETDFFFFRNRGEARIEGLELETQAELAAGFRLAIAAHVVRGRAIDDAANLDDIPPDTLTLDLRKTIGRGFVRARAAFHAGQDRPGPTEQARPGRTIVDASAGFDVTPRIQVHAHARNLFDASYLVSPDARAVLAPGRSVLLAASIEF